MPCECCDGELIPMGALGNRTHFRCRSCGMESSAVVEPIEYEDLALEHSDFDAE